MDAPSAGGSPAGGSSPEGGDVGNGGAAGAPVLDEAWKSDGCGTPFKGATQSAVTISTHGVKADGCADAPHCGAWSLEREYTVYLPHDYDPSRAYSLVLEGAGCGATSTGMYELQSTDGDSKTNNADGTVIRVGLRPPPSAVGAYPASDCFDDREGDDSVDFVFYEALYDELNRTLCFDRNLVFASGYSNGGWFANEVGCKYAGDLGGRPVRGIISSRGGLPTEPEASPTCSTRPMAGFWVWETTRKQEQQPELAISRAMKVNGCSSASYDTAQLEDFPFGGELADSTCQRISGCPDAFPLVVCPLPVPMQTNLRSIVNPGAAAWLKLFAP